MFRRGARRQATPDARIATKSPRCAVLTLKLEGDERLMARAERRRERDRDGPVHRRPRRGADGACPARADAVAAARGGRPPEPVIPVLIMPRTPPAPPGSVEKPRPIRLHRRQLRHEAAPPEIPPFIPPATVPQPRAAPSKPAGQPRFTVQPSPANQLSTALRGGLVGCANPSLLSPSEREKCQERLGRGATEAAPIAPSGDAELDRAATGRQAARRYRDAPMPAGIGGTGNSGASNRNKPLYSPTPPPLRP